MVEIAGQPEIPKAFAVVANHLYFIGLKALVNSLYIYHKREIQLFIFHQNFENEQIIFFENHPIKPILYPLSVLPFSASGTWEAKQQVFAFLLPVVECVFLLDADLVITSRLDDVFALAQVGKIVSSSDGVGISYSSDYAAYNRNLPGRFERYVNTGALCLNTRCHWDLVSLWAFASQYSSYSPSAGKPLRLAGHGDQGVFNAILHSIQKGNELFVLPEEEWCDSTKQCCLQILNNEISGKLAVINTSTGGIQRLVHCTGTKWWHEDGFFEQNKFGDKYKIFEHFQNLTITCD